MRFFIPKNKLKNIALFFAIGAILAIAVWQVFFTNEEKSVSSVGASELEQELALLLNEIDGVGDASVMIYETQEGVQSVVVVCDGANDLQVNMDVREAVAAALGTSEKSVKIYLRK